MQSRQIMVKKQHQEEERAQNKIDNQRIPMAKLVD